MAAHVEGPDGGGLDALWPVGATGDYELTATYAIPAVGGAVTPCAGGTAMRTVKFTVGEADGGFPWLWIGIGAGVLVVVALFVVVLLLRKRKPAAAVAVALVLLGLSAVFSTPGRPAYADFEIDPTKGIPVPDFQNPTGVTMSLPRRRRLIELANAYGVLVLEDTPYRDLRYDGEHLPTLRSLDTEGRVVHLGSFSKILAPGMRLGWAAARPELVEKLGLLRCK